MNSITTSILLTAPLLNPWLFFPLLFCTGLVAGFVDSIAGGGGLITLPVLLSIGLDPTLALSTNKLQATCGSSSAAYHYTAARVVQLAHCVRGFLLSALGAAAGTLAVLRLNPSLLGRVIPLLLLTVAVYTLVTPRLGAEDLHPRLSCHWFDAVFGLLLGFYDGFFGPGTGTFWTMAYMLGLGFNFTKATGYAKVMNFASNLSSLVFFMFRGRVAFAAGVTMGFGQLLGARIGSRMVIAKGAKFIRPIFILVVIALSFKLIWGQYRH